MTVALEPGDVLTPNARGVPAWTGHSSYCWVRSQRHRHFCVHSEVRAQLQTNLLYLQNLEPRPFESMGTPGKFIRFSG